MNDLLTRPDAWKALMQLTRVNGQRILHRTITEMHGQLHMIATLADGETTIELILPHEEDQEPEEVFLGLGPRRYLLRKTPPTCRKCGAAMERKDYPTWQCPQCGHTLLAPD